MKKPLTYFFFIYYLLLTAYCFSQDSKGNSDFKLAVNLYNDGMYDLAAEQFKTFINAYPNTSNGIEARYYLGLTQMKLKRYDDARNTFQNFALTYTDNPKAPQAWMYVAESFLALNNKREAASAYERVKVFYPKSQQVPDALINAAELYRTAGERDNARKIYRAIVQDYPTSQPASSARLALAEFYAEEGQIALAEQEAKRISESDAPPSVKADALYLMGSLKSSASLFDDAEKLFKSITSQYQGTTASVRAALALASLLDGSGNHDETAKQLRQVLSVKTDDSLTARVLFELAGTYAAMKNYDSVMTTCNSLVARFPNSILYDDALYTAGTAALSKKDYKNAALYFKKILAVGSSSVERQSLIRLADAAVAEQRFDDAANVYQLYIDHFPNDACVAEVGFRLGKMYEAYVRDYRKAIAAFNHVIEKFPESPFATDALYEVGQSYEQLGNFEEAFRAYSDLLSKYPSRPHNDELQKHVEFLQHHNIRNRDVGMEKLARLVGEMLIQPSKSNVAFQLGQVYFDDLKDYDAAVQQFTFAIENGLDKEKIPEAKFLRARAYHLLSEVDSSIIEKAVMSYEEFHKLYPMSQWSNDAAYYSFQLKSKTASAVEIISKGKELLLVLLRPEQRAELLVTLGTVSLSLNNRIEAITVIQQLEHESKNSSIAQQGLSTVGNSYADNQHLDTAITYWKRAMIAAPKGFSSASLLKKIADSEMQLHVYEEAITTYEKLINEFSYTLEAENSHRSLANAYEAAEKFDEVIKELEEYRTRIDASPFIVAQPGDITLQLAKAYEKKGLKQKALALYNEYLFHHRTGENAGQAYYSLGVMARNEGRSDIATAYFKEAATLGSAGSASKDIADLFFQNEQYPEAIKQYKELARTASTAGDKKRFQAKVIVATLRMDKSADAQKLIAEFDKSFGGKNEYKPEFEYEKALSLYRKEDYTKAKKAFENVADDFEKTRFGPWAEYYIGKIYEVTNQLDKAAKQYVDVFEKYQNADVIPRVLLSLGNMHYNAERYEDAIRYYQHIVSKGDTASDVLPYAMNNLIEAYESTKLYEAALKLTRDFIARYLYDESISDKKIKIGTLYTKLGYYDQAILHFQSLLEESGSMLEAELRYDIGETYYDKGDFQQAILEFLKVPYLVARQGKVNWTATALYMAGQSYEKMSKFEEAIGMYQQIVSRSGIDATFKAAAKKEIERVKSIVKKDSK